MLSHISSVLNSCSTVFTMDLYKPFLGRGKPERHLVLVGRVSAFVILALATLLAIWFSYRQLGVFVLIQNVGAWVAAPIAAVFLLGVLVEGGPRRQRRRSSLSSRFRIPRSSNTTCSSMSRG